MRPQTTVQNKTKPAQVVVYNQIQELFLWHIVRSSGPSVSRFEARIPLTTTLCLVLCSYIVSLWNLMG